MTLHRNTVVSAIFSFVSLCLTAGHFFFHPAADLRLVASLVSLAAFGLALSELKRYSSTYQFFGILFSMVTLGISIDHLLPAIPFITLSMLLSFITYKKFFRKWFSETDMLWLDPVAVIASAGVYVYGNIYSDYGWKGWVFPVIPLAVNTVFAMMDFASSKESLRYISNAKRSVEAGKPAPEFLLPDKDGKQVRLSDFRGKQHVLLVFIRNDWCPSCRIKLRTYERHRQKFNEKNIQLLTISPGGDQVDKEMTLNLGINFNVLYDEKQEICRQYGVQLPVEVVGEKYAPGMPLPASFLVDKNGIVRYTSRPDRIGEFLDPESIFPALELLN